MVDLLSTFPWDAIFSGDGAATQAGQSVALLRLVRLVRLLRVLRIGRLVKRLSVRYQVRGAVMTMLRCAFPFLLLVEASK